MNDQRKDIHNSGIPVLCRACEARHKGICGALNEEQLVRLNRYSSKRSVPSGSELIGDEQEVSNYANVLSGVVKLAKTMADGRQQIVGLQFAPDFLGRPFHASSHVSAEAASDVSLCAFPKALLETMIKEQPALENRLHRQALRELDEAREWMLTLGRKTAGEKVASFLHMIAHNVDPDRQPGEPGPASFDLPLTRADIADFLGLTIETVSRQLTRLRKAGIIEIENNRHVFVPELERLERAAGN
ncbi:MAG: Crp/Fnr family transcriptional regulator [Pseudomonadota bacterium]|nr:Crp/Fnr family transcriptional regulator [Pseudomonadota bacterium]